MDGFPLINQQGFNADVKKTKSEGIVDYQPLLRLFWYFLRVSKIEG